MTTKESPFGDRAFSIVEARGVGVGYGALYGPRFDRPYVGVRRWHASSPQATVLDRCESYSSRLRRGQFFSHDTALALWGAPLAFDTSAIHIAVWMPASPPRTRGVIGHRLRVRDDGGPYWNALPLERPERAWVQVAVDSGWPRAALIAAADHLVFRGRKLTDVQSLRAEALRCRQATLLSVLDDVRTGAESPKETELRLVLQAGGLPEPELNVDLCDPEGRFIARLDLAYRAWRVAVEFDGRQHAEDPLQFRRDAERWDAIRDAGWVLVRVLNHHLFHGGDAAVARTRSALERGGWRRW